MEQEEKFYQINRSTLQVQGSKERFKSITFRT